MRYSVGGFESSSLEEVKQEAQRRANATGREQLIEASWPGNDYELSGSEPYDWVSPDRSPRRNPDVILTIGAPPGAAQDFVLRVLGTHASPFQNTEMRFRTMSDRLARTLIEDLGRASGADFNVVVRPGTGGRILVQVTEAARGGRRGAPPRSRASRTRSAPPPPLHRVDDDDDDGDDAASTRRRHARYKAEDRAREEEGARQREAKFAQDRADDARRRAAYEEERRRTEEARKRYDEEEARRRREDARRRASGQSRETPGDRFRAQWGTYVDPARAKIIDRIKKLLRTATHPASNKNEAASAQAHADELMREHGVRAADIPDIWRRNRRAY